MLHNQTHKNTTITPILLLRRVIQTDKPHALAKEAAKLVRYYRGIIAVLVAEGVVVEGHAIDDRDEEQRPVRAAFGNFDVVTVVDWEEDVCYLGEVGEGLLDRRVNTSLICVFSVSYL